MSALMTRRRRSGPVRSRDRDDYGQTDLFSQVVAPPPRPESTPVREERPREIELPARTSAPAATTGLTLEDAITSLWGDLTAGELADCPVCGAAMEPRHSAGSGVVGGRCTSCATTLA